MINKCRVLLTRIRGGTSRTPAKLRRAYAKTPGRGPGGAPSRERRAHALRLRLRRNHDLLKQQGVPDLLHPCRRPRSACALQSLHGRQGPPEVAPLHQMRGGGERGEVLLGGLHGGPLGEPAHRHAHEVEPLQQGRAGGGPEVVPEARARARLRERHGLPRAQLLREGPAQHRLRRQRLATGRDGLLGRHQRGQEKRQASRRGRRDSALCQGRPGALQRRRERIARPRALLHAQAEGGELAHRAGRVPHALDALLETLALCSEALRDNPRPLLVQGTRRCIRHRSNGGPHLPLVLLRL
mmetsp:Transcript_67337/g.186341  ORF Transcript_67337/g.186341 Transcript_67337/m.186341 type:complete len:298 (+) Transcript_67337:64-957(+)